MKNVPLSPWFHALPTAVVLAAAFLWAGVPAPRGPGGPTAAATAATGVEAQAPPQEGFSFQMRDYSVNHQGQNTLNVSVRYRYRDGIRPEDYPDFQELDKACDDFFVHYPHPDTFWEIMNKELTALLLEKFPVLTSVTIEIQVSPTARVPFPRASMVTRTRL